MKSTVSFEKRTIMSSIDSRGENEFSDYESNLVENPKNTRIIKRKRKVKPYQRVFRINKKQRMTVNLVK
jgi:hypothetical protein